jgi:hypothetical protein
MNKNNMMLLVAFILHSAMALTITNTADAAFTFYPYGIANLFAENCEHSWQYPLNAQIDDASPLIGFELKTLNLTSDRIASAKFVMPTTGFVTNTDIMRGVISYDPAHKVSMDPTNCPDYHFDLVGFFDFFFNDATNKTVHGEIDITSQFKQALDSHLKYLTLYLSVEEREGSTLCQQYTYNGVNYHYCNLYVNGHDSDKFSGSGTSFTIDITEIPVSTTITLAPLTGSPAQDQSGNNNAKATSSAGKVTTVGAVIFAAILSVFVY